MIRSRSAEQRETTTSGRRARILRRLAIALGLYAGVSLSAAAWAYWGSGVDPGAHGAAVAASVNQAATPSASLTAARTVTVTWGASTLTNGRATDGYLVRRYDAGTSAAQTILTGCTGTITTTSCVENSVPLGQWTYTVTPVIGTNWQGAESPHSGTVVVASATLTLAKTLFGGSLPQPTTGTLTGFAVNEGVSYRLDAATSLTGSPSAADGSGNATITSLTIPNTGDGPHTVYALGNALPASQASAGIVVDTTAPTVGATLSPTANGAGWNNITPAQVTLTADDGTGSGINQIRYTIDGTDPTMSGTAAVYSAPLSVSANKTVNYYATDIAGNASAVATRAVKIDTVAPSNSLALSNVTGNAVMTGTTVYYQGLAAGSFTLTNALTDTGGSGPAASGTAALSGTSTGWTHVSSSVGGPYVSNSFNWSAGTTTSPSETVTGTDVAANTASTTLTYVDDSAGPTGGSVDAAGLLGAGNRYSTSTTLSIAFTKGTDGGAGLAASGAKLFRASTTLTNGACGGYGASGQVGVNDPTSPTSDVVADQACYRYLYAVADTFGNVTTYASADVKVDTTGPAGGSVDATGLVGTGGRYSASTGLGIAFSGGGDASGLAASGAQLKRATAALANGACGGYGPYTQVGADDPTSPKPDPVADQACYRYQYMVADAAGNSTTYSSGDIKVDTTAPSAPTLSFSSFTNTYWSGSGPTLYYRSNAASGSFTATAAASDPVSGIAGYTFPGLGTNWAATAGALDVTTYSWSGAPAAPGSPTVTATSNAATSSAATSFTMTSDTSAPGGGSVTYPNGVVTGTSISVTFAAGTDAGSGLNASSGLLQRAAAPLAAGTCGSYAAFTQIATNPASPYSDNTATTGYCYQYRYRISDNVGNQATYTNANVARLDYATAVSNTAGLVSYWHMGVDPTPADTFSGATGGLVSAHTPDTGGAWIKHVDTSVYNTAVITNQNRVRKSGDKNAWYYNNTAPPSANYAVEADVMPMSAPTDDYVCLLGRNDGTVVKWYEACYADSTQSWEIWKAGASAPVKVGAGSAQTLTVGQTYRLRLDMNGSTISLWVDGVQKLSATDASFTVAGFGGIQLGAAGTTAVPSDTTGWQLDNWRIVPNTGTAFNDSKGTNDGTFTGTPLLNVPGALVNDANTAAQFSAATQYGSVANNALMNVGDVFTLEAWVKRNDYGTGTQVILDKGTNAYKLYITGNRLTLAREGASAAVIAQSSAVLANDTTSFHHYAATKNGATVRLYVDGIDVTGTVTNVTLADSATALYVGSKNGSVEALNGVIDEVALYNQALTGTAISDHNRLGRGI